MKKKIKEFQSLKNVNVICKSKLKHLKGGERVKGANSSSEVD